MIVHRRLLAAAVMVPVTASATAAYAQQAAPPPGSEVTTTSTTTTVQASPTPSLQPGSTYVPQMGYGNPQSENGTIGGGNATESSAHPITGGEEDSFDFKPGAGGAGHVAVHGNEGGPIFSGRVTLGGEVPDDHLVRRGDTLWGISDFYFKNPYQWPRLWSYNPQIKNPNWIYPGDQVRLKTATASGPAAPAGTPAPAGKAGLVDRRRRVPSETVFLRDAGWIRDASDDTWGEVTGAASDKLFLSDLDEIYMSIHGSHEINVGDQLTLFRTRQTAAAGAIVQVLGTVRIDDWNPKEHVARAKIIETLDVIERGAKVGPVARSFEIVPPRRNDVDVRARVLASLHPNEFFGQNQVVFIDKGDEAGLRPGNRLLVMRRGDAWRQTLVAADMGYRVSADDERPMPPMEKTPGSSADDANYPNEYIAELRVIDVKKDSAVCLVTHAKVEIELRDVAVARKGY
jgi:hypothetical protein